VGFILGLLLGSLALQSADSVEASAAEGANVFQEEACVRCHSVAGKGGSRAPDLARRIGRDYTPAALAALMWNHAPAMWTAMQAEGIAKSTLSEDRAADLFAFLYAARYFEKPGDAGRGKRAFESEACGVCHSVGGGGGVGPSVSAWESLQDPIALIEAMWNHAGGMRKQLEAKNIPWPRLTSQELADILVYLQNLPAQRNKPPRLSFGQGDRGADLFQSKSCANCHTGSLALDNRLRGKTLTEIAVDMWNHAPMMERTPIRMDQDDMRAIVSYLWSRQLFQEQGNAARGKKVFASKNCGACHNDPASGAPDLARSSKGGSAVSVISVLWEHGPRMLEGMREKNIAWPRFNTQEMRDLIAHLQETR
jgi:mono/diheme cytochrome c family protein